MSSSDFANVYASINNLQNQFDSITGNSLSNYNQLSRIVSQQSNIYNTIYYGTGNLTTGNLSVTSNYNITGNLNINNGNIFMNKNGNLGVGIINSSANLHVNGNAIINGNLNVDNGTMWIDNVNNRVGVNNTNPQYNIDINGDANISGDIIINNTALFNSLQFISSSNMSTPFKMVYGNVLSGSVGPDNIFSVLVTFPNSFSSAPWIVLVAGTNSSLFCTSSLYTATGFTANGRNISTASSVSSTINYLAIGPA